MMSFSFVCLKQIKARLYNRVDKGLEICLSKSCHSGLGIRRFLTPFQRGVTGIENSRKYPIRQYKPEKDDTDTRLEWTGTKVGQ